MKRIATAFQSASFALALGLLFTCCVREPASSVDQDKIFAEYELFYDENEDKTYARAVFRFSNVTGTQLELDGGASVKFGSDELSFRPGLAVYEKAYPGFKTSGTFTFTDLNKNTFVNNISINKVGIPADLDSISRANAFEFFWTGAALAADENVAVTINNANAINPQVFIQNKAGTKSIVLAKNQLSTLLAGNAFVIVDRRLAPPLQQKSSAGGIITGRYRPKNQAIVLYN
jgi:hypothetical protein